MYEQRRRPAGPNMKQKVATVERIIWSSPHVMEISSSLTMMNVGRAATAASQQCLLSDICWSCTDRNVAGRGKLGHAC